MNDAKDSGRESGKVSGAKKMAAHENKRQGLENAERLIHTRCGESAEKPTRGGDKLREAHRTERGKHEADRKGRANAERLKNVSETDRRIMEWKDPHQKAMTRRENEGIKRFREDSKARREFAKRYGLEEHKRWEGEQTEKARNSGRKIGTEYTAKHPDGSKVRYDRVDFKRDTITDRKAIAKGERPIDVIAKNKEQMKRHIEAYPSAKENKGKRPLKYYEYSLYPSTSDLAKENDKKKGK